jgi:hypothetical protein
MKITLKSKDYGNETIDTESFSPQSVSTSSPVFKVIEELFDSWFDYNTQPGAPGEIYSKYYGDGDQPAIYDKKGAIIGGIENMIELLQETGKNYVCVTKTQLNKMDIESAFE